MILNVLLVVKNKAILSCQFGFEGSKKGILTSFNISKTIELKLVHHQERKRICRLVEGKNTHLFLP